MAAYESAVATAAELQETLLATAAAARRLRRGPRRRGDPHRAARRQNGALQGTQWRQPVPLVLIDTDYEPFTVRPRPEGRVIYLRPAQEHDYLASLAEAGLIQYLVA